MIITTFHKITVFKLRSLDLPPSRHFKKVDRYIWQHLIICPVLGLRHVSRRHDSWIARHHHHRHHHQDLTAGHVNTSSLVERQFNLESTGRRLLV